jgi:hypothetical protein
MSGRDPISLIDRVRRFWKRGPDQDHPLSAREREEDRPATALDARARVEQNFVGGDFDPDERGTSNTG